MKLKELTRFLDEYLAIADIEDISLNGLQVEGRPEVNKIALATDACLETFHKASALRSDLLLVHHGIFWGKPFALKGIHLERIKVLISNGISLYAVHLPLDLHAEIGNNIELVRLLGYTDAKPFGTYHGVTIGYSGSRKKPLSFDTIISKLKKKLGADPVGYRFGPDKITTVAVISGGGASMLEQVTGTPVDLFLTGELSHSSYHLAKELGVNILFSGHYCTETPGIRSLGTLLSERFGLKTTFIDVPTGM